MTRTMKAAVVVEVSAGPSHDENATHISHSQANAPLVIQDLPVPQPTGRQLLVRVKAATLCHSDVTTAGGGFGTAMFPVVIGHEAVTIVEELGPDAAPYGVNVGDTIGAGLWQDSCLACAECKGSGEQFCPKLKMQGITTQGYFAEYALIDAATAVVVRRAGDESQEPVADLAPMFCAGVTVWDALERAEVKMGQAIAIIGLGGLGSMAALYAQKLGARVIALDVRDEQLLAAKNEGSADEIINTKGLSMEDLQKRVAMVNGGRLVEKAIVTTGATAAYDTSMGIVGAEGTVVGVGLAPEPITVSMINFAIRCTR